MTQFNLYLIIGLILLLVATSGSFYVYRRITLSEIAVLEQQNVTYRLAVEQQQQTIETMVKDAEALSKANAFLSSRMTETEASFAAEWSAIEALDLASDIDGGEIEKRVNDEFGRSIEALRKATVR